MVNGRVKKLSNKVNKSPEEKNENKQVTAEKIRKENRRGR